MNRRDFLKTTTTLGLVSSLSSVSGCIDVFRSYDERLKHQLNAVFEDKFKTLKLDTNKEELLTRLKNKKIIDSEGYILTERVQELALTDEMQAFENFYYTSTELDVYALSAHNQS